MRWFYNLSTSTKLIGAIGLLGAVLIAVGSLAVSQLGTLQAPNYWDATKGNAGRALSYLLAWAKQYPEATFEVS